VGSLVKMHTDIFKKKRILITGDTGFKGSWLSLWLHKLGANIVGYALPPKQKNDHFNLLKLDQKIHHIQGDIRNFNELQKVLKKFQPEFLFHLAAQALVIESYQEPRTTFETNTQGSTNILECVRLSNSLKSVIYVTSDKCYLNKELTRGYKENDELGGKDPYSASKAAAEIAYKAYFHSFFQQLSRLGIASVRAGNVIGGGDWSNNRIVPDCIRALKDNKAIILRNPKATRPWQHVLEPLSGYLKLASFLYKNPKKYSSSWNFGPNHHSVKTVHDVTKKIIQFWGKGEIKIQQQKNQPYEAKLLQLDCSKAHQNLNWFPLWNFNDTIFETVQWYKRIHKGSSAIKVSSEQIEHYMREKND
jgi:CDP-glucose 4,6-dehydratase